MVYLFISDKLDVSVCTGVYIHMLMCVWRPEVDVSCLQQSVFTCYFWDRVPVWLGWMAREPQRSPVSASRILALQVCATVPGFLKHGSWGRQLRCSCLYSKCFNYRVCLPQICVALVNLWSNTPSKYDWRDLAGEENLPHCWVQDGGGQVGKQPCLGSDPATQWPRCCPSTTWIWYHMCSDHCILIPLSEKHW